MTTRRKILKTAGGVLALTAVGGAAWTLTRAPKQAREPWKQAATGFEDPVLDALAYAILAPNPHNMQPWVVQLEDNGFTLFCDPNRQLPETDPPARQITIGFGCFLELFRQAAAEKGLFVEINPFPEGEPHPMLDDRPVAQVRIKSGARVQRDPLFGEILNRRTNRIPFDMTRPVTTDTLDAINSASVDNVIAKATNDTAKLNELRALAVKAWEIEWADPATRRESIAVTRIGKREINSNPWGLSMAGPLMEGLNNIGVLNLEDMDVAGTTAYDETLKFYNKACESAMGFVWTTTTSNTRFDQLAAGASWVRMQLKANQMGVAFHPLSQALQEFPSMAGPYAEIHQMLAEQDHIVQMFARLGYADAPPPAPREPLTSKLVDA